MKILYHHRTMGRGAEGSHVVNMVEAMRNLGHEIVLISPPGIDPFDRNNQRPLDKTEEKTRGINSLWKWISRNAPTFLFEIIELFYNLRAALVLNATVKRQQIDCIYERSAFFLMAGAFIAKRHQIPFLLEANEAVGIKRARPLKMIRLAKLAERYSCRQAQKVFTVSSYLKEMLAHQTKQADKVVVLPNAVNPERFQNITGREKIREKLGLRNRTVLGFAGWFDWWDRLDILIEIQRDITDAGFGEVATLLIGDGTMVDTLKEQISKLGLNDRVILTGPVPKEEVLSYIDAIDIGVLPHSNLFGSPMVLFEMMALAKCVIAAGVPPVKDVLREGENGFLFPPLDKEKLREQLVYLLQHEEIRRKVGEAARQEIMACHTWRQNAQAVLEAITVKT